MELQEKYPHISFIRTWGTEDYISNLLGQCEAYKKAIINVPVLYNEHQKLLAVSLQKGAQATTAIEGNTLTEQDIKDIIEKNKKLPPSMEYLQTEVTNVHEALNYLRHEVCFKGNEERITPDLIKKFHKMIGKDIGEQFQAIPGQYRERNVTVSNYRCPDYTDVVPLVNALCDWLPKQFGYGKKEQQSFSDIIIQAIVTHVYIEWIHPFSDGNGRTGRLLEFYILLRGGNPDIASHLLSNHYNNTRTEYYRQLQNATNKKDLTDFIRYALQGFKDGLEHILEKIQANQFKITWKAFIYDTFDRAKGEHQENSTALKRLTKVALEIPIDKEFTLVEIPTLSIGLAGYYSPHNVDNTESVSQMTLKRDIEELLRLQILTLNKDKYKANTIIIKNLTAKIKLQKTKVTSN